MDLINRFRRGLILVFAAFSLLTNNGALAADPGATWGYYDGAESEAPQNWKVNFATCGGSQQSPVHVQSSAVYYDSALLTAPFTFTGYSTTTDIFSMENNGHTAGVSVPDSVNAQMTGGKLPGTFKLASFHFHWGTASLNGSEHVWDNTQYPLEMHLVHLNTKYSSVSEALPYADGLAVLGVFLQVGGTSDNSALAPVIGKLKDVTVEGTTTNVGGLDLSDLLPADVDSFFRYQGSLTTPPCSEAVTWTLFSGTMKISQAQYDEFLKLQHGTSKPLVQNHRPLQPLKDRKLYASMYQLEKAYEGHWDYSNSVEGPSHWADHWHYCGGETQSPINLDERYTVLDEKLLQPGFSFNGFDASISCSLTNNGHSEFLSPPEDYVMEVSGGGLGDTYQVLALHFHWGSSNKIGSDHLRNSFQYPMEMHMVMARKQYLASSDITGAFYDSSGLAVLGIFFEIGYSDNPAYNSIVSALPSASFKGTKVDGVSVNWNDLLPPYADRDKFFRYQGSLTTPPCYEAVKWTVFSETVKISQNQMDQFQNGLYATNATYVKKVEANKAMESAISLVDNFRPTQLLNSRQVTVSSISLTDPGQNGMMNNEAVIHNVHIITLLLLFIHVLFNIL